jgi:hypothetical protein
MDIHTSYEYVSCLKKRAYRSQAAARKSMIRFRSSAAKDVITKRIRTGSGSLKDKFTYTKLVTWGTYDCGFCGYWHFGRSFIPILRDFIRFINKKNKKETSWENAKHASKIVTATVCEEQSNSQQCAKIGHT